MKIWMTKESIEWYESGNRALETLALSVYTREELELNYKLIEPKVRRQCSCLYFPVEDEKLKKEVIDILKLQLADTLKAHILKPNGREYAKQDLRGLPKIAAQDEFCKQALESREREKEEHKSRIFEPVTAEGRI